MNGKQIAVLPYNEVLFSLKKERSADTHYNKDEPGKHCAEQRKPDRESHILRFHSDGHTQHR